MLDLSTAAYTALDTHRYQAGALTAGPWHPEHQHAGPPIALVCRAIEQAAAAQGLTHIARLTANLLRPVPVGELTLAVVDDYVGRNAGHFSAQLMAGGKEVARFTALAQREQAVQFPSPLAGHPLPQAPRSPEHSPAARFGFAGGEFGYARLVEKRLAQGEISRGPCAVWFRLQHPLVGQETPSPYQRVAVAADSGNGISTVLDYAAYSFVNSDLTINFLRRPIGEWICLEARMLLGDNGGGLAESALYDSAGLVGRATQSLAVRPR
ncbi:MAG: thioesterase family protein [Burkholderiaceae bacterium]|nr:thioesterase family protein [Burkholderiaceae bacterium]